MTLLAEHGPEALSTRRVAAQADTSSMAVYTQFGSIAGLVQAVIDEGFHRLATRLAAVPTSDDPVADLVALAWANIHFAREAPNLYQVMFGTVPLGQYRRETPDQLKVGRDATFGLGVAACDRAIIGGRLDAGSSFLIAHQWWCAMHGFIMLEISGYIQAPASEAKVLSPLFLTLFVGLGDAKASAVRSIAQGAPSASDASEV